MASKLKGIFFLIVALGVGLYLYNSGLLGKGASSIGSLSPGKGNSSGTTFFSSLFPHYNPGSSTNIIPVAEPKTTIRSGETGPGGTNSDRPSGTSPYYHLIRFGSVSPGSFYSYGQISLYASPAAGTSIDVTGWHLKTMRGGEYIPQAVNVYDPLGLNPATDIKLTTGMVLNIYSTSAPVNLRLNKCMGYLPNKSQFNPQLPQTCPYIDRSEIQAFTGACQNYIMSLGGCQSANLSSPYIPQNDYACIQYLSTHFSYRSCFDEHQVDADFSSNEVRVWMGSSPLDPYHDTIVLLDRSGLLVDSYSY